MIMHMYMYKCKWGNDFYLKASLWGTWKMNKMKWRTVLCRIRDWFLTKLNALPYGGIVHGCKAGIQASRRWQRNRPHRQNGGHTPTSEDINPGGGGGGSKSWNLGGNKIIKRNYEILFDNYAMFSWFCTGDRKKMGLKALKWLSILSLPDVAKSKSQKLWRLTGAECNKKKSKPDDTQWGEPLRLIMIGRTKCDLRNGGPLICI